MSIQSINLEKQAGIKAWEKQTLQIYPYLQKFGNHQLDPAKYLIVGNTPHFPAIIT